MLLNCDRHTIEPVTLSKYVAEYEQMLKWMVEFLASFRVMALKLTKLI